MKASKIVIASAASGLVAGGLESKKLHVVLEMEGSMTGLISESRLVRIRDARGRWVPIRTMKARLDQLGAKIVHVEAVGAGEHLPVHP